jgi:hypothetical protein
MEGTENETHHPGNNLSRGDYVEDIERIKQKSVRKQLKDLHSLKMKFRS